MNITFNLQYVTAWGQELYVVVGHDYDNARLMSFTPGYVWTVTVDVPTMAAVDFHFQVRAGGQLQREETVPHRVTCPAGAEHLNVVAAWHDDDACAAVGRRVVTVGYFEQRVAQSPAPASGCVQLQVAAPDMASHHHALAVVGSTPVMGQWDPARAIVLRHAARGTWQATLCLPPDEGEVEYKLLIVDTAGGEVVEWESGVNRWLDARSLNPDAVNIVTDLRYRARVRPLVGGATAASLMQLRSERGSGCGDLADLKRLINWAHATGQRAVILANSLTAHVDCLPWGLDAAVCRAIDDYALDVIYLHVPDVGELADKKLQAAHQRVALKLNSEAVVDSRRVAQAKIARMRDLHTELAPELARSRAYKQFVRDNEFWLKPYAAFRILSDLKGTSQCGSWGQYATYDATLVDRFLEHRAVECQFVYFVQYQLYKQFRAACAHASRYHMMLAIAPCEQAATVATVRDIEQALAERRHTLVTVPLTSWPLLVGSRAASGDNRNPYNRLWMSMEALTANTALRRRIAALLDAED